MRLLIIVFLVFGCKKIDSGETRESHSNSNDQLVEDISTEKPEDAFSNSDSLFRSFDSLESDESIDEIDLKISTIYVSLGNDDPNSLKFNESNLGVLISGFEVISDSVFLFSSETSEGQHFISKFEKEEESVVKKWEKPLSDFRTTKLTYYRDTIIFFSREKKVFFRLDKHGETLIDSSPIVNNKINDFQFWKNTIICELYNLHDSLSISSQSGYAIFNFDGVLIDQASNQFNIDDKYLKNTKATSSFILDFEEYLDRTLRIERYKNHYYFDLIDRDGVVLQETTIPLTRLKLDLDGGYEEHIQVIGKNLYLLGIEEYSLLIYKVDLESMFENALPD